MPEESLIFKCVHNPNYTCGTEGNTVWNNRLQDQPNSVAYQMVEGVVSFTIVTGQLAFKVT